MTSRLRELCHVLAKAELISRITLADDKVFPEKSIITGLL